MSSSRGNSGGHGGDLLNSYAAADGSARADFLTGGITLDTGEPHSVFDDDGSAIIVHERPDPYAKEESDTGSRLACDLPTRVGCAQAPDALDASHRP
ncbi:MAG: superoxide dismutase family protein [Dehalococcoidia bacterium]|nr:superoxide dismutase family protein [Dehalococcoidia bacterium]